MLKRKQFSKEEFNQIRRNKEWLLDPKQHQRLWQAMKKQLLASPENRRDHWQFLRVWLSWGIAPVILFLIAGASFLKQSHTLLRGSNITVVKIALFIGMAILVITAYKTFLSTNRIRSDRLVSGGRLEKHDGNFLEGLDADGIAGIFALVICAGMVVIGVTANIVLKGFSAICLLNVFLPITSPFLLTSRLKKYLRNSTVQGFDQWVLDANEDDASNYRAKIHQYRLDHPQLTDFSDNDLFIVRTELDPFVQKVAFLSKDTGLKGRSEYLDSLQAIIAFVKTKPSELPTFIPIFEKENQMLDLMTYYEQESQNPNVNSGMLLQKKLEIESLLKEKKIELENLIKQSETSDAKERLTNMLVKLKN